MTHEQFGRWRREALPWGAIVAAVAFGWSAVGQLIDVRDDLLDHCHSMDVRITRSEQWQRMHESVDDQFRSQVVELMRSLHEIQKDLKVINTP